jgi:hypothetical protein
MIKTENLKRLKKIPNESQEGDLDYDKPKKKK